MVPVPFLAHPISGLYFLSTIVAASLLQRREIVETTLRSQRHDLWPIVSRFPRREYVVCDVHGRPGGKRK